MMRNTLQAKDKEEGKAASQKLKIWKYQVNKYSDPLLKLLLLLLFFCDYDFFTHYAPSGINYCFSQKERLLFCEQNMDVDVEGTHIYH